MIPRTMPPEVFALQHDQVVEYRLGRAGRETVEWGEWKTGPIHVQRRDKAYRGYPAGPCVIAFKNEPAWAEYDPASDDASVEGGVINLLTEDYYAEIRVPA